MTDLPKPKMIIFDCDGTLVDTEMMHMDVMEEMLHEHKVMLPKDEITQMFTGATITKSFAAVRALGFDLPEGIEAAYGARFEKRLNAAGDTISVSGALECFLACKAKYPVAVATNGEVSFTTVKLQATGFYAAMPDLQMFTKDIVARPKPAPDLFLYVADKFGIAPAECWVIEDSIPGVTAGVAAGMTVIGYTGCAHDKHATRQALLDAGAAHIFEDYSEFPLAL